MPRLGTTVLASLDLDIRQGADVPWALTYRETTPDGATVSNTFVGWSARAQIRQRVGGDLWLDLSSAAGTIILTAASDKLTIAANIGHAVTEPPAWDSRNNGVWDIELTRADGTVIALAEGRVSVTHDVTRA